MLREPQLTLEAKASLFDQIVLYEKVDVALLDRLIEEGTGWLLPRYRKTIVGGRARVCYTKQRFGRAIVTGALGLHNMERSERHRLARDYFVDWDMKNAHPTILLQVCLRHGLPCSVLTHYVTQRESILNEVATHYGVTKDEAKTLFLRMIFGGGFAGWARQCRVVQGRGMTQRLKAFSMELSTIARVVTEKNPDILAYVKGRPGSDNVEASVLSTFLQETECRILESLFRYCVERAIIQEGVAVLCNDGFMLETRFSSPELAGVFTQLILTEHGFTIEFLTKAMNQVEPLHKPLLVRVERPSPQGDRNQCRFYLKNLYPTQSIHRMMSMEGNVEAGEGNYRTFAFVSENGSWWRDEEGKMRGKEDFHKELLSRHPAQLHLGELRCEGLILRELVFDVDVTSFTRFCSCGEEKKACSHCWLHIEGAGLILHHLLVSRLSIPEGSLLWVLSGMKGFHCLVNEHRLLYLTNPQRVRLLTLLRRKTLLELKEFGASLSKEFSELLHERFETLCIERRRLLECEAFALHCLEVLEKHYGDLHSVVKERWVLVKDSVERWAFLSQLQRHSRQEGSATLLIILSCYYPVVDEGPMRCGKNVFKMPFSIHPKTHKLSLPIALGAIARPTLLDEMLSVDVLCEYYRAHNGAIHPQFVAAHELFVSWLPRVA